MTMSMDAGRIIASCFALAAFTVALIAGMAGGNAAAQILLRAVVAMIVCYPVGLIAGGICDRIIQAHTSTAAAAAKAGDLSALGSVGVLGDGPSDVEVVDVAPGAEDSAVDAPSEARAAA